MNSLPSPARWSSRVHTIRLEGPDARRFLHGQSSQALEGAAAGSCLATCLISPTARMRGLALARVETWGIELVVLSGSVEEIHRALDRVLFPADQVRLGRPEPAGLVRLLGPAVGPCGEESGPGWLLPGVDLGTGSAQPALLLHAGDTMPAWLEAQPELSAEQAERQRIRQGFPAAPQELNDDTNPFELGLAAWVSLSKGCYVGQETLARLATYDGVKQQLRHWRLVDETSVGEASAIAPGASLSTPTGDRAGVITSGVATEAGAEGLALVRRSALAETTLLTPGGATLRISTPPAFRAPPVGSASRGTDQP